MLVNIHWQVAVIKRKEITLGIDANFERAGKAINSRGEETVIPTASMHGPRSCFRWTLIDKPALNLFIQMRIFLATNLPL